MGTTLSKTAIGRAITIDYDELIELIKDLNKKCSDTAGTEENTEYLCFAINKDTVDNPLWKATIKIICFKKKKGDVNQDITNGRTFNLRQFMRLYRAIEPLINTVYINPNKVLESSDIMTKSIFEESCTVEGECVICLERTPDTILPCTHAYCSVCLQNCQKYHQKCPLCRIGSTYDEDQWVVPEIPENDKIKNYVEELSNIK